MLKISKEQLTIITLPYLLSIHIDKSLLSVIGAPLPPVVNNHEKNHTNVEIGNTNSSEGLPLTFEFIIKFIKPNDTSERRKQLIKLLSKGGEKWKLNFVQSMQE